MHDFFNSIATAADLKELKLYETGHYIMSDGLVLDDVVRDQLAFLDRLFK